MCQHCAARDSAPPGELCRRFCDSFSLAAGSWSGSLIQIKRHRFLLVLLGLAPVFAPLVPVSVPLDFARLAQCAARRCRVRCEACRRVHLSLLRRVLQCPAQLAASPIAPRFSYVRTSPDVLDLTVLLVVLLRVSGRCEPSFCVAGGTRSDRLFLRARHPKADASPRRVTA
jgi:hypothetical protein